MTERFLPTYHDLFVHRNDLYAQQNPDGSYYRVNEPVTSALIESHLKGELTAAFYALKPDNPSPDVRERRPNPDNATCKWVVVDADREDGLELLLDYHRALRRRQVPSHLESSRQGRGHLWIFTEPMSAKVARATIKGLLPDLPTESVELFPKQDRLSGKGVGNCLRGPLGMHRKTGQWYPFVSPRTLKPVASSIDGNLQFLTRAQKLSLAQAAELLAEMALERAKQPPNQDLVFRPNQNPSYSPQERVLERIGDIYSFVSSFVRLDNTGRGSCPFHPPDVHPSFSVNKQSGYWQCFHEQTGGDAISFYARLKGINYRDALADLEE